MPPLGEINSPLHSNFALRRRAVSLGLSPVTGRRFFSSFILQTSHFFLAVFLRLRLVVQSRRSQLQRTSSPFLELQDFNLDERRTKSEDTAAVSKDTKPPFELRHDLRD